MLLLKCKKMVQVQEGTFTQYKNWMYFFFLLNKHPILGKKGVEEKAF